MADWEYTRETSKAVQEAVAAVEQGLAARKFAVLWHLDVRETLKAKGVEGGPVFHILEVCSAPRAKEALDANLEVGYFLPCKMVVYERDGRTCIGLLRPTTLMNMLGEPALKGLAEEVDAVLREVVDEAAR